MIRVERTKLDDVDVDTDEALSVVLREPTPDGVSQVELTVDGTGRVMIHMVTDAVSADMAAALARHLLEAATTAREIRAAYETEAH